MKLCVLLLALLGDALAISLPHLLVRRDVGPKECAHGPEYWCRDLEAAKSCGALQHCIQNVWQHMSLPKDNSDICETCKKMVQEARDQLESNETQEEIREVLEGTCRIYFPVKALANECIKFVDEFIPQLIEMLASRMDPQVVCATAGLCNADGIKHYLTYEKGVYRLPTYSDCRDCKKYMKQTVSSIEVMSKEEVRQRLMDVCTSLPKHAAACHLFMIENFEQIYDLIKTQVNSDDVCQLIGMCDETTNVQTITSLIELFIQKTDPDPECQFCEQLVAYLKNILTANSTEEELKEAFLAMCHSFGKLEAQCEKFVNDNFQEIYDFLTDQLDPDMICTAIHACNNGGGSPLTALTPAKAIKFAKQELSFGSNMETNDVNSAPFPNPEKRILVKVPFTKTFKLKPEDIQLPITRMFPQSLLPKNDPQIGCALCEYVLHYLQEMLMDNRTTEAIKDALDRVCGLLPKTVTDECVDFIGQYGDAILALIAQQIDPSIVCYELKICKAQVEDPSKEKKEKIDPSKVQLPLSRMVLTFPAEKPKSSETCQICQYVMGIIHNILKNNNTKEAIESALQQVCQDLPKPMQTQCTNFVKQYGDEILTLLQEVDPSMICVMIKLCPSLFKQGLVPIKDLKMGKCDVCQMVVDYIDKLLEEQTVEEDITKVLEKVCDIVPQSAREQCDTIIEAYGPYVLQLLGQLADSKKVCQALDLCETPSGQVHLLGGKKCTYGPSYWCQSKFHAKACKADKYCTEKNQWKN